MRYLQNITCFTGTLLSTEREQGDIKMVLEDTNGERSTFIHRVEESIEGDVVLEQAKKFLLGRNIFVIGDHITIVSKNGEQIPIISIEEIRFIGKTFMESVREVAKTRPMGLTLHEVKEWKDVIEWFREISRALWDSRYKEVRAANVTTPIVRSGNGGAVQIKLNTPRGEIELLAVTQDENGLDAWAEAASKGDHITWFAFKLQPSPGIFSISRLGRVHNGEWKENEGIQRVIIEIFGNPVNEKNLKRVYNQLDLALSPEKEKSTDKLVIEAAYEEVVGKNP